jgi:protein SCO1
MSKLNRREILAALAAAPLAADVLARTGVVEATVVNSRLGEEDKSREKTQKKYFPNFELTTHEGRKVRFYDDLIKDKIVVINFMYAKCEGICPAVTMNLKQVQNLLGRRVGRDIFMYSITLKPDEDTPSQLQHYVHMHHLKPGWTFLTGKPDEIGTLRRTLGFYTSNTEQDKDVTNHIGVVRYGNEARQWWAMCPGKANPAWMVESILWMDDGQVKPAPKTRRIHKGMHHMA